MEASKTGAEGQGHGSTYARCIRSWIRTFIDSGKLPKNQYGYWNISILDDEDVCDKIKLFLLGVGKYARAADVVEFLSSSATRTHVRLTKAISIRTAQMWFARAGYRWRSEPTGQYFVGHERADVVTYRQTEFLPVWRELECRSVIYNDEGVPDPQRPLVLQPGEARVNFWFSRLIHLPCPRLALGSLGSCRRACHTFPQGRGIFDNVRKLCVS
jgi:hypothetical protein